MSERVKRTKRGEREASFESRHLSLATERDARIRTARESASETAAHDCERERESICDSQAAKSLRDKNGFMSVSMWILVGLFAREEAAREASERITSQFPALIRTPDHRQKRERERTNLHQSISGKSSSSYCEEWREANGIASK